MRSGRGLQYRVESPRGAGLTLCLGLLAVVMLLAVAQAQSTKPVIILLGPPASGKSTQAASIQKKYGYSMITREQLMQDDPSTLARQKEPGIRTVEPRVDPALNNLFLKRLDRTNVSKGLLLDGYPASKDHGDFLQKVLTERGFRRPRVLKFELSDEVVRERLKGQPTAQIDQDLKDYHREMDYVGSYFPQADIVKIDASKKEKDVYNQIQKAIDEYVKKP